MNKKIVVCGKSGSGKDYLLRYLSKKGMNTSVKYTSRPMRDGEREGVTYYYLSKEEFETKISEGYFILYESFIGWYYGHSREEFNNKNIFIMTPGEIKKLNEEDRERSIIIYIDIDKETRRKRISFRNDNNDSIERRIEADERDFLDFNEYDIRVTDPNYDPSIIYNQIYKD